MDYGIARAQHLEGLTTTGAFLGTPNYAAPETVEAGGQPRSDIYSLGVVFFEMLTGSTAFPRRERVRGAAQPLRSTPPPVPSSLNYALPEVLDRIVLRLLSKEPASRPTAEELLNELSDYLAGGAVRRRRSRRRCSPRPRHGGRAGHLAESARLGRPGGRDGQRLHRRLGRRHRGVLEPGGPVPAAQAGVLARPQHRQPQSLSRRLPDPRRVCGLHDPDHREHDRRPSSSRAPRCRSAWPASPSPCRSGGGASTSSLRPAGRHAPSARLRFADERLRAGPRASPHRQRDRREHRSLVARGSGPTHEPPVAGIEHRPLPRRLGGPEQHAARTRGPRADGLQLVRRIPRAWAVTT